jgi:cytoskeletal protein RodZ
MPIRRLQNYWGSTKILQIPTKQSENAPAKIYTGNRENFRKAKYLGIMEGKLDKLFKEKLARHKVNPSDHTWDQINLQLAGKRRSVWTKRLAVAASFLILISAISIGYLYIDRIQSSQPKLIQSKTSENPEIKSELKDEITTPLSKGSKSSEIFADQQDPIAEPLKKSNN